MAVLWERSAIPWVDGDQALSGAKAYFFDANTTTPMTTYTDSALGITHDHPVVANSMGLFPAIFLVDESVYKFRIEDADGVVVIEVDGVTAPTTTPPEFPDSNTPVEQTIQTGHIIMAWRASAPNGFVRLNGRTIGAAASGATERANADCVNLFTFLYNNDVNLTVSGGRGSNAASDWAANKQISLPDWRGRGFVGPDSFGNSASGRITDAELGADSDLLGAVGGDATHTLTTAQLAAHNHTINVTDPGHRHFLFADASSSSSPLDASTQVARNAFFNNDNSYEMTKVATAATLGRSESTTTGITAASVNNGSGDPHNNLQPSIVCPVFIKL